MSMLQHSDGRVPGLFTHFKAAAVAAALMPLASFAATPAEAQTTCTTGTISGFVWYDLNNNGIQDPGEEGIGGALVTISAGEGGTIVTADATGHYSYCLPFAPENVEVTATVPPGYIQPSPANQTDDAHDSDGEELIPGEDGEPDQVTTTVPPNTVVDFGFWKPNTTTGPGTGTPGYWKNHPEAWPVESIVVGGKVYTKAQAIQWLNDGGSDKSATMFSSLLPAMLNVLVGNNGSCVAEVIGLANNWLVSNPLGSKVKASSAAWKVGEPWHRTLDNYNNGMLCAPHRD